MPGLILPSHLATAPVNSLEQRNECHLCGFQCDAVYTREFLRHVRKCAAEHEGDMQDVISDHARSVFAGQSPDPERDAHFARGGN